MRIICVIPARAESSRFFEKPLALICDKPMIQWVYEHCKEVEVFEEVYVATDSGKIKDTAEAFGAKVIMTSPHHDTATERLYEVSTHIPADLYVMVNGDEPLLTREAIVQCIPSDLDPDTLYVSNLMTDFSNPVEVVDSTNLKIVTAADNRCLFISRSPIPYPKGTADFEYEKITGIQLFSKKALDFYAATPKSALEKAEENDLMRFIENGHTVHAVLSPYKTVSVDTPKDVDIVCEILKERRSR